MNRYMLMSDKELIAEAKANAKKFGYVQFWAARNETTNGAEAILASKVLIEDELEQRGYENQSTDPTNPMWSNQLRLF